MLPFVDIDIASLDDLMSLVLFIDNDDDDTDDDVAIEACAALAAVIAAVLDNDHDDDGHIDFAGDDNELV